MATYYVRMSGNDSNTGLSPAQAWRTLTKALSATGLNSGDVCYLGAGTYRETVTANLVSPTAETRIVGDVTGVYTGDAGEVILSSFTKGDYSICAGATLALNQRNYLTFENLTIIGGSNGFYVSCVEARTPNSSNITFRNCTFFSMTNSGASSQAINVYSSVGVSLNWTIDGCRFLTSWPSIQITINTSTTGADWNLNFVVSNSLFLSTTAVSYGLSGTSTYRGNGIHMINCTCWGNGIVLSNPGPTTSFPSTVRNTLMLTGSCSSNTVGALLDMGGNRAPVTGMSNITTHPTSRYGNMGNLYPLELGQSSLLGLPYRHPFTPYGTGNVFPVTSLGFGGASGGTMADMTGTARPSGVTAFYDSGTASSATSSTLTDSTKSWPSAYLTGWLVRILSGTGAGQVKRVLTNSSSSLTISGGAPTGGIWAVTPDATSSYVIYQGLPTETGKATGGTTSTLIDAGALWDTNMWQGFQCAFDGQVATVLSNTATTLTFSAAVTNAPTTVSQYSLYYPNTSLSAVLPSVGAVEGSVQGRIDSTLYAT